MRVLPQDATGTFKDSYLLDFLDLPEDHNEADLQSALLQNLRKFLMELGDGFAFVGEKIRVQVGNQDFELDLLFYHRDLQCLVAFNRDRKRPHENLYIGVLLCRTKDNEVVEICDEPSSLARARRPVRHPGDAQGCPGASGSRFDRGRSVLSLPYPKTDCENLRALGIPFV